MSDSILQVNLIKNKGGTATGITVDNSNANVTIGNLTATTAAINAGSISNVPNIYHTTIVKRTNISSDQTGTTEKAIGDSLLFNNKKAGSTCYCHIMAQAQISVSGGSSSLRYGTFNMYNSGTSSVSATATSGFGTHLTRAIVGRTTNSTNANAQSGYYPLNFIGEFTSNSSVGGNNYLTFTCDSDGSHTRVELFSSGTFPVTYIITELA